MATQTSNKELQQIASWLTTQDRRLDGLISLAKAIAANVGPTNYLALEQNRGQLDRVFVGLRACLKVSEDEEDTLMKTN